MSNCLSRTAIGGVILALCWCASPAAADPLVVTSGGLRTDFGFVTAPLGGHALGLLGNGFQISGSLEEEGATFQLTTPPALTPGGPADFSGVFLVTNFLGATFNGVPGLLTTPLTMSFTASPTSLACTGTGQSTQCTGSAPFTFAATLTFTPTGGDPVTHAFTGGGNVQGTLFPTDAGPFGAVDFEFASSPTPEPATVWLFMTGAMMTGAAVRRIRAPLL